MITELYSNATDGAEQHDRLFFVKMPNAKLEQNSQGRAAVKFSNMSIKVV